MIGEDNRGVLPVVGRWQRRRQTGCRSVDSRLAVLSDVRREDLVDLMMIYDGDMNKFGYTWSETTSTAKCSTKTAESTSLGAALRHCC